MSNQTVLSLHTLPVPLVYHILDHLSEIALLVSMYNVCQRLNTIIDSYHRYQVNFHLTLFFRKNWLTVLNSDKNMQPIFCFVVRQANEI